MTEVALSTAVVREAIEYITRCGWRILFTLLPICSMPPFIKVFVRSYGRVLLLTALIYPCLAHLSLIVSF